MSHLDIINDRFIKRSGKNGDFTVIALMLLEVLERPGEPVLGEILAASERVEGWTEFRAALLVELNRKKNYSDYMEMINASLQAAAFCGKRLLISSLLKHGGENFYILKGILKGYLDNKSEECDRLRKSGEYLDMLVEYLDLSELSSLCFYVAIKAHLLPRNMKFLQFILNLGVDPSIALLPDFKRRKWIPLLHIATIEYLLRRGGDPDLALDWVIKKGALEEVRRLLEFKVDISRAVVVAIDSSNLEIVALLLDNGADLKRCEQIARNMKREDILRLVNERLQKNKWFLSWFDL